MFKINPLTIEVEMRDYDNQQLLKLRADPVNVSLINSLKQHIEDHLGGLLCMSHFNLPDCQCDHIRGRWIVRINSCCQSHMRLLEQRLQTFCEG